MIIGGVYSFNNGLDYITEKYPDLYDEIRAIITAVDATQHKTKQSKERRTVGRYFYQPSSLNKAFKAEFQQRGWVHQTVKCVYPNEFYAPEYQRRVVVKGAFRDIDFVKRKLGVEVQFGKYSFMVYNVSAKMTIFKNLGIIDAGVEIVPMRQLVSEMSSGVSYFEQFIWDLQHRGVSNIDIPVLILGIDVDYQDTSAMSPGTPKVVPEIASAE